MLKRFRISLALLSSQLRGPCQLDIYLHLNAKKPYRKNNTRYTSKHWRLTSTTERRGSGGNIQLLAND